MSGRSTSARRATMTEPSGSLLIELLSWIAAGYRNAAQFSRMQCHLEERNAGRLLHDQLWDALRGLLLLAEQISSRAKIDVRPIAQSFIPIFQIKAFRMVLVFDWFRASTRANRMSSIFPTKLGVINHKFPASLYVRFLAVVPSWPQVSSAIVSLRL